MTRRLAAWVFLAASAHAQAFDVASVKPSAHAVSKDDYNRVTIGPATFTARNITLKRLIEEAYALEPPQVFDGPKWLDESQYDVDAKSDRAVARAEMRNMLQALLAGHFHLAVHRVSRELKAYQLVVDRGGPKIHPVKDGEGTAAPLGSGHFHGNLRQLANLIAIQLTIPAATEDPSRPAIAGGSPVPVFNQTGLDGTYDFDYDMKIEPGTPSFNRWQNVLQQQLGLKLESRKTPVDGIVVDSADRVPAAN